MMRRVGTLRVLFIVAMYLLGSCLCLAMGRESVILSKVRYSHLPRYTPKE